MKSRYHQHTFYYQDDQDYVRQLDMEIQRVCGIRMEPYVQVRDRYKLKVSAFCMRLRRFIHAGGRFPHVLGPKGVNITDLAVTPALDHWLRKPSPKKRQ